MMRYPAVFEYDDEERVYNVHFPDIGGCVTFGDDLDEAKRMASEALTGVLLTLIEKGRDTPLPPHSRVPTSRWSSRRERWHSRSGFAISARGQA
jgi:predicted RNase H-like HicB family nuclease